LTRVDTNIICPESFEYDTQNPRPFISTCECTRDKPRE